MYFVISSGNGVILVMITLQQTNTVRACDRTDCDFEKPKQVTI